MNNRITYDDKVALNENPLIPDINKVKADDMNEIKNVVNGISEFAVLNGKRKDVAGNTAWTDYDIAFDSNDEFSTSNPDLFEMTSAGIKCKFNGPCLIIRAFTLSTNANDVEFDIMDDYRTYYLLRGLNKNNFNIKTVSNNEVIGIKYVSGVTDFIFYNSRIIVLKLR